MIPPEYRWTTQAGQELDIRWMDTPHLVNTVNLLIRQNKLDRKNIAQLIGTVQALPGRLALANMVKELKARMPLQWQRRAGGTQHQHDLPPTSLVRTATSQRCGRSRSRRSSRKRSLFSSWRGGCRADTH